MKPNPEYQALSVRCARILHEARNSTNMETHDCVVLMLAEVYRTLETVSERQVKAWWKSKTNTVQADWDALLAASALEPEVEE